MTMAKSPQKNMTASYGVSDASPTTTPIYVNHSNTSATPWPLDDREKHESKFFKDKRKFNGRRK